MDKLQRELKKTIDSKLNLLGKLWGRLKAENATSLTDEEIERVFCTVSLPKQCIFHAKKFRDIGALYIENGELKCSDQILIDYFHNLIN